MTPEVGVIECRLLCEVAVVVYWLLLEVVEYRLLLEVVVVEVSRFS